ncbi:MAG: FAD-dependent oxidoreductase, partial [Silicimonas sp.]|nr:FAD-dependent oxidoreductase [Silicimonas sp.]
NSGRLSVPCVYEGSPLNSRDALPGGPDRTRPGACCPDAPLGDGFLLDRLRGNAFTLLAIDQDPPDVPGLAILTLGTADDPTGALADRYLGNSTGALYLIRPDQHVAARWDDATPDDIAAAVARATGKD